MKKLGEVFKAVLRQRLSMTEIQGNGDPIHEVCIAHRIPRARLKRTREY